MIFLFVSLNFTIGVIIKNKQNKEKIEEVIYLSKLLKIKFL